MKINVRGIFQKLLKYWSIRQREDRPSKPVTQRIMLEIYWFQEAAFFSKRGLIDGDWFGLLGVTKKKALEEQGIIL